MPGRFERASTAYGYGRVIFEQVAAGVRPPIASIIPSTRHVGVPRRDTFRQGFGDAVRASREEGYPVLVRSTGGGASAVHYGIFGFSVIRPATGGESRRTIRERYDGAAALVLGAFLRLGVRAEIGEVRDEFCPGDHSVSVGGWEDGAKIVGIAQRISRRATSVGGHRASRERGGSGARSEAGLRSHEPPLQAGERRQPAPRRHRGRPRRGHRRLRRGGVAPLRAVRVPLDGPTRALARRGSEAHLVGA